MALFTGKGDNGKTTVFGCDQKISKSSDITEALGALDEVNSFLGFCKVRSEVKGLYVGTEFPSFEHIIHELQQILFTVQAEVAGADKNVTRDKILWMEDITRAIESELPPITTFFISGGTELAATFDFARTLARRAERRVVAVQEERKLELSEHTVAFLNRLSTVLYALARLSNHKSGIKEEPPSYK